MKKTPKMKALLRADDRLQEAISLLTAARVDIDALIRQEEIK